MHVRWILMWNFDEYLSTSLLHTLLLSFLFVGLNFSFTHYENCSRIDRNWCCCRCCCCCCCHCCLRFHYMTFEKGSLYVVFFYSFLHGRIQHKFHTYGTLNNTQVLCLHHTTSTPQFVHTHNDLFGEHIYSICTYKYYVGMSCFFFCTWTVFVNNTFSLENFEYIITFSYNNLYIYLFDRR